MFSYKLGSILSFNRKWSMFLFCLNLISLIIRYNEKNMQHCKKIKSSQTLRKNVKFCNIFLSISPNYVKTKRTKLFTWLFCLKYPYSPSFNSTSPIYHTIYIIYIYCSTNKHINLEKLY